MIEVKDAPYMSGWDDYERDDSSYEEEVEHRIELMRDEERED